MQCQVLIFAWIEKPQRKQAQGGEIWMFWMWLQGDTDGKYEDPQASNARRNQIPLQWLQLHSKHTKKLIIA